MSGGHFNYNQYIINDIAYSAEDYIDGHDIDECDIDDYLSDRYLDDDEKKYIREHHHTIPNPYGLSEATVAEFRKGIHLLRQAYIYAQRMDWLLSGDDGEESFHSRLKEDLEELENKTKSNNTQQQ